MNIFTNPYDIDVKIDKQLKKIIKTYLNKKKTEEEKRIDNVTLKNIVDEIVENHITNLEMYVSIYYNKRDLLEIVSENKQFLLDIFDMNKLIKILDTIMTNEEKELFENNDNFRREILFTSLYKIIKQGGAYKGAEYGLIFAKEFNFDLSIPMSYASYNSKMSHPRLKEFIDKYLELGGSKNVYWLPYYFEEDNKNKFMMEELNDVIQFINLNKNIKSYSKKLH